MVPGRSATLSKAEINAVLRCHDRFRSAHRHSIRRPPKAQPLWLSAAYGSFVNKKDTNYQIQMGVIFRYDRCPELRQTNAVDLVASAWLACKPLVDLTR
jgi:hypothetical protein